MALHRGNPLDDGEKQSDFDARLLERMRTFDPPLRFNPPPGTPIVTAEEQRAAKHAEEERRQEAAERRAAEMERNFEQAAEMDSVFADALAGVIESSAAKVALGEPNPLTASREEVVRWEERVRADERQRLDAAAGTATTADDDYDSDGDVTDGDYANALSTLLDDDADPYDYEFGDESDNAAGEVEDAGDHADA
jgi:hypothetical protein